MAIIDQAGRAGATTTYWTPPPDLGCLVVEGWIQRYTDAIRDEARVWRVVPDLQPHLIIHRRLGGQPEGPRIVGSRSVHLDVAPWDRDWSVGVTLRPGALPAIAGLPASDLTDRSADPEETWGPPGTRLRDRISGIRDPRDVFPVLRRFLRGRVHGSGPGLDWRVTGLLTLATRHPGSRLSYLARTMGVSPRTLRGTWQAEVGLSPREALSIGRIHRAVHLALEEPGRTWSRVAGRVGFYDQSHLIRDFRRYLGETPASFLARRRAGVV